MTMISIVKSVRTWGIRGIIDYLHRWPILFRLVRSDRHGYSKPQRGITLIGPFSSSSGNAQTMRQLATLLLSANIPLQTFDTCDRPTLPKRDYLSLLTPGDAFDISRYSHVIELFSSHAPKSPDRIHALLMFWEFDTGLDYAFPEVASGQPLIAMSDFNVTTLKKHAPPGTPIYKILYPLGPVDKSFTPCDIIRTRYKIPHETFMVFFNFDYGSSYYRKNPEAVLSAFAKAFLPDKASAVLVLKTSTPREPFASHLKNVISALDLDKHVILIEGALSQNDMTGLINACDTYISLHRGEGFGIGMAEAMSMAKPVIATAYSANTEFCLPDCTFPIPYKMIPVPSEQKDISAYQKVSEWADADVDSASTALRKLYSDPILRTTMGQAAKSFIDSYFSLANFKNSVEGFLNHHT